MHEPDAKQRLIHGVIGFFLGAGIAISVSWWFPGSIPWWAVVTSGVICAMLTFCWGEPLIEWLKEVWWWS